MRLSTVTRAAMCRSPHGERELKFAGGYQTNAVFGRSPHGERELKFDYQQIVHVRRQSLPTRGA